MNSPRDSFDEVLKKEHQVDINAWIMVHVKSMSRQEMAVDIVAFNDVLKLACLLKVWTKIYTTSSSIINRLSL